MKRISLAVLCVLLSTPALASGERCTPEHARSTFILAETARIMTIEYRDLKALPLTRENQVSIQQAQTRLALSIMLFDRLVGGWDEDYFQSCKRLAWRIRDGR